MACFIQDSILAIDKYQAEHGFFASCITTKSLELNLEVLSPLCKENVPTETHNVKCL